MSKIANTMTVNLASVMPLPEVIYKQDSGLQFKENSLPFTECYGKLQEYLFTTREVYFSDTAINIKCEVEDSFAWLSFILPFHLSELREFLRVMELDNYSQDNLFLRREELLNKSFKGYLQESKNPELYQYVIDRRQIFPAEKKLRFANLPDAEVDKIRGAVSAVKSIKKDISEDILRELLDISGKELKLKIYEISDLKKEELNARIKEIIKSIDFLRCYTQYVDLFSF